ncbi:hypothetical protein EV697_10829 [Bisgaardia hudsonensis]|uniref:Lipoprotein n=1 Tax=Bisgaardia hudsonensis TaxID=109472 RepID=A0A4R2MU85_9PAST|nr:hypothetical protein [Bisgaardia hudsonensis]QLB12892.1 hypothetical protein A6A11_04345 [Bisgaardia hudsonensis]TCP11306.1 hypothetical protein EV697_10829 [Bisgaardia hudsonensis]
MMKKIFLFSVVVVLSGCYLANGSPSAFNYWLKNNKNISFNDLEKCSQISNKYVLKTKKDQEVYNYLRAKFNKDPIKMINSYKEEYEQYRYIIRKLGEFRDKCYYDLGYRFQAPLSWCLAQDSDNTQTCIENMKYRK